MAIIWTLLIFIACFIPGNEIPNVHIPLIDKWVHFVLFGGFTLLWLLAAPGLSWRKLFLVAAAGCVFGWLVEELQGLLSFLGRSKDLMDIWADALGAVLGVILFYICAVVASKRHSS
ncbi:MAG: VanZ family protein [Chitinophagaceae bacterium]|nr:VanZ family protein [Chitinophagaceae bacterium]